MLTSLGGGRKTTSTGKVGLMELRDLMSPALFGIYSYVPIPIFTISFLTYDLTLIEDTYKVSYSICDVFNYS